MHMYEHAIEFCDFALQIDKDHIKTLYRKARSLAYLFKFAHSIDILRQIG